MIAPVASVLALVVGLGTPSVLLWLMAMVRRAHNSRQFFVVIKHVEVAVDGVDLERERARLPGPDRARGSLEHDVRGQPPGELARRHHRHQESEERGDARRDHQATFRHGLRSRG